MNAQLPQIVNENVLPNGCSFWGSAAFREFGYLWQLLCWNMTHTAHQAMSVTYIQGVYKCCRNCVISLTVLFFCWCEGSLSTVLGNESLDAKRKVQSSQKNKIKRCKFTVVLFLPVLCQVLLEWDKIHDKPSPLFHGAAIIITHTQTIIGQNKIEYNQMLNGRVPILYSVIQRKGNFFLWRQIAST